MIKKYIKPYTEKCRLYEPICAGPASKWQAGGDGGDTGGEEGDDFTTDAKINFSLWDELEEEEEW